MKNGEWIIQEQSAGHAFGKQAPVFDQLYGPDKIVQYKRQRVREHVEQWIKPGSAILELRGGRCLFCKTGTSNPCNRYISWYAGDTSPKSY